MYNIFSGKKYTKNIIRKKRSPLRPCICKVKDIDCLSLNQKRAGVIVYDIDNNTGKLELCWGVDHNYGSLTDFGGGVKNCDNTVLHTALREFKEETYGAFNFEYENPIMDVRILNSIAVFTDDIFILFLRLKYCEKVLMENYKILFRKARRRETRDLYFMDIKKFYKGLNEETPWIFFPIRDILKTCFEDLLKILVRTEN